MLRTLGRGFANAEVRKRIFYTLGILVIVRLGCLIPIPGVDTSYFGNMLNSLGGGSLNYLNMFTGGSFSQLSLFALGITPYITSSIIIQLLTIAFPKLEEMQREGEDGRKRIQKITKVLSLILAVVEAVAMGVGFGKRGLILNSDTMSYPTYFLSILLVILAMIAGATALMWIGDRIAEHGIGNGISMILLFNIIAGLPADFIGLHSKFIADKGVPQNIINTAIIAAVVVVLILLACVIQDTERRIPVSYSQKMVGRRTFGDRTTHIPLKVNTAGVMPVIFASSIMQFPVIIVRIFVSDTPEWMNYLVMTNWLNPSDWKYTIGLAGYIALIFVFAYFYTNITFNPLEIADNLRRSSGVIPGVLPGTPTSDFLASVVKSTVFIGAIGLSIISVIPIAFSGIFGASVSFGGTSMIIIVSVTLETLNQMEAMMRKKHYKGFLKEES